MIVLLIYLWAAGSVAAVACATGDETVPECLLVGLFWPVIPPCALVIYLLDL